MKEFYSLISGTEVRLERGFIDLTSLAILAGFKFHKNMTAMGVQVIGTLLNKTVSTGDDCWGTRWNTIPASLQCYALGDIKFGFITYNVLAGLLLRDLFPDPDVLCRYLECTQEVAVNWFLEFLMLSLEGIEFHQGDEEAAQTREELVKSLRFRDENEKLCHTSPPYIRLWTEILGSWPSLTSGGCRFLLQCRQWLPVEMRAFARAKIQWSDGRIIQSPKESDLAYSRFGLTPEQIGDQTWSEPVPRTLRMMRPPGIKAGVVNFDMATVRSSIVGKAFCSGTGRSQRWCVLEWVMLTPENLKKFFTRMGEDEGFRRFYQNLFDLLRLAHLRIFNEKAPLVEPVNKALNDAVLLSLAAEEQGLKL